MPTAVGIVSDALTRLGQAAIASFDEPRAQAYAAKHVYDQIVNDKLSSHPWTFALREHRPAELLDLGSQFSERFAYAYALPQKCLRVWGLYPRDNYVIYGNEIYTDLKQPTIIFVEDVEAEWFAPYFASALVLEIVAALTPVFTENVSRIELALRNAAQSWQAARARDSDQRSRINIPLDEILFQPTGLRY